MVQEERLVDLFLRLININAPSLGERDCVNMMRKHLTELGFEVAEDRAGEQIGGNANNLIAWMRGTKSDAPRIFLSAHFDTVEPTNGLIVEERHGIFRSVSDTILGADDKAGMAPAVEACLALRESGMPHGDICLLFSVAEEIGLLGARALAIEELGLDFGYVLDTGPPVGSFVNRTAYHDKLDIEIIGKPAHAGKDPEKGVSAIQVAADAISRMKLGRIGPETTANIGVIQGGTGTNVVCASVTLQAEARSTALADLEAQIDHMVQTVAEAASKWGAEAKFDHRRAYSAYHVPEDSPIVRHAMQASRALGFEPFLRTTLGGSDANAYNEKGVPCIVIATGMDKIHTHDECISRKDLVDTARLTLEILKEIYR